MWTLYPVSLACSMTIISPQNLICAFGINITKIDSCNTIRCDLIDTGAEYGVIGLSG